MDHKEIEEIIKVRDEQWEYYLNCRAGMPKFVTHSGSIPGMIYKQLTPYLNDLLVKTAANVREECAQLVRANCQACEGTGNGELIDGTLYECEYCGRTMSAIRKGK